MEHREGVRISQGGHSLDISMLDIDLAVVHDTNIVFAKEPARAR